MWSSAPDETAHCGPRIWTWKIQWSSEMMWLDDNIFLHHCFPWISKCWDCLIVMPHTSNQRCGCGTTGQIWRWGRGLFPFGFCYAEHIWAWTMAFKEVRNIWGVYLISTQPRGIYPCQGAWFHSGPWGFSTCVGSFISLSFCLGSRWMPLGAGEEAGSLG